MVLVVLGFITILLVSFGLVLVVTSPSPQEKAVDQRIALIHTSIRGQASSALDIGELLKPARTGRFGWLEDCLDRFHFSRKVRIRILQANSSTTISTLIMSTLGLFLVGYAVVWLFAPMVLLDLAGAVALAALPYGILSFKRARRISAFNAVLVECIDMMARALRAGHSMVSAIELLSESAQEPAASEFAEIFHQQNLGLPLRDALMHLLDRVPSLDLRVLVTAILVQKDTGGNLAEILDRTVLVIRERLRIQGEIRVHTAQGRMTGWILSALPVIMLLIINFVNPGYSSVFMTEPAGHKMIYASIAMLAIGTFCIHRIVNGIEV